MDFFHFKIVNIFFTVLKDQTQLHQKYIRNVRKICFLSVHKITFAFHLQKEQYLYLLKYM